MSLNTFTASVLTIARPVDLMILSVSLHSSNFMPKQSLTAPEGPELTHMNHFLPKKTNLRPIWTKFEHIWTIWTIFDQEIVKLININTFLLISTHLNR